MSTRANIIIADADDELIFYRHSDGYPEGTMPSLNKFLDLVKSGKIRDNVQQSAGWLTLIGAHDYGVRYDNQGVGHTIDSCCGTPGMCWKVGAYEPSTGIHGDIDHLYVVDLQKKEIRHCKVKWDADCNAQVPRQFYSGRFNPARRESAVSTSTMALQAATLSPSK